jgi:uncharacterized protein YbjT (DUF2867 family)
MPENRHSPSTHKTLITGATGRVGGALVDLMTESSDPFRVIARRPDQLESFRARGIEAVRGDYDDAASLRAAMQGCQQLFLVSTGGANGSAQDRATIDSARAAGVQQIVKISGSDANPASSVPWAADYGRSDEYLRASGVPFTVLRPSCFMSNLEFLAPVIRRGLLPGTSGHGATTWTDPDDLAMAAHVVLTDPDRQGGPGERGGDHLLTSTQPLSFPQVAEILTDALQHRIRYVHIPGPVMYAGMRAGGSDHRSAHGMVMQFADVVRHGRDDVRVFSPDLERLIGRPGTRLETFIDRHRDVFA